MKRLALLLLLFLFAIPAQAQLAKAVFAGGCFWCTESDFEKVPGVVSAVSGYTGGAKQNPTYDEVSGAWTGHREAVEITYDPKKVSYGQLLDHFWRSIDPTDNAGQFCDHGPQYRSAIFVANAEERRLAETSKGVLVKRFGKIATDILPASRFWPAEDYHQDYYKKNPVRYHFYRYNCGRDQRLKALWEK